MEKGNKWNSRAKDEFFHIALRRGINYLITENTEDAEGDL